MTEAITALAEVPADTPIGHLVQIEADGQQDQQQAEQSFGFGEDNN